MNPNPPSSPQSNPVVEVYKGVTIRKYNKVVFRVDQKTFKNLIDLKEKTGLSMRKLLGYSTTPCDQCKDIAVRAFNDQNETVEIPRGLLYKRIPNTYNRKPESCKKPST